MGTGIHRTIQDSCSLSDRSRSRSNNLGHLISPDSRDRRAGYSRIVGGDAGNRGSRNEKGLLRMKIRRRNKQWICIKSVGILSGNSFPRSQATLVRTTIIAEGSRHSIKIIVVGNQGAVVNKVQNKIVRANQASQVGENVVF